MAECNESVGSIFAKANTLEIFGRIHLECMCNAFYEKLSLSKRLEFQNHFRDVYLFQPVK